MLAMYHVLGEIPCGIMFHHFHGGTHPPSQGSISGEELEIMLQAVGPEKILPAEQWWRKAVNGTLEAGDLSLTFDDNLRCQFDVALPVLRKFQLTAFWFIYTSVLDGYADSLELYRRFRSSFPSMDHFYHQFFQTLEPTQVEQADHQRPANYLADFPFYSETDRKFRYLRDEILGRESFYSVMDQMIERSGWDRKAHAESLWMDEFCLRALEDEGHLIGLHSHTHPTRLGELSPVEQNEEYRANYNRLKTFLRKSPVSMSHPCNSYNQDTLETLKGLGIQVGFCSNMRKRDNPHFLEFPREDHANLAKRIFNS